ncbi:response regulator [Ornithinibacillus salinisoli]|uniref:Response regulator n=1 Tax=Ornithinibacillus salinisoli TaxID=1848459 RepID=A0ABW4VZQ3_9BACI
MIKAILVDDEELSIIPLVKKLQKFKDIDIVKTYSNPKQVVVEDMNFDVVFLDIEMQEMDGLNLAEEILSKNSNIQIVFVTAHSEYAIQAFEIHSIDYLLKPVTTKRLEKTIKRLKESIAAKEQLQVSPLPESQLSIKCFGELQVYYNKQPLSFKTAKAKELFAFLLTYRNTYIHRDKIIEELWPNQDYKKSKTYLHTCLSHVRKLFNSINYSECILFKNQHYCLQMHLKDCDAFLVEDVIKNVTVIDESNIELVKQVIHSYDEPYLDMNGYNWAYEKSQEFHQHIIYLLYKTIEYYKQKDMNKSLYFLEIQRKLEPYVDENIAQSMELLIKQNNRSEAIKLYQEHRNLITEDLGIEPSETVKKLYGTLLNT